MNSELKLVGFDWPPPPPNLAKEFFQLAIILREIGRDSKRSVLNDPTTQWRFYLTQELLKHLDLPWFNYAFGADIYPSYDQRGFIYGVGSQDFSQDLAIYARDRLAVDYAVGDIRLNPEGQALFEKVREFVKLPEGVEDDASGFNEACWLHTLSTILFLALDLTSPLIRKEPLTMDHIEKGVEKFKSRCSFQEDLVQTAIQRLEEFFTKR